ncbi:MAG: hypothetical protein H6581_00985 [Bacteroidia bacterium]|nr:hypothetical protein [Bacteroidia bacterium]
MLRILTISMILLLAFGVVQAQKRNKKMASKGTEQIYDPLKKNWLLKVDPASGLVNEFRAMVEKRWADSHRFWFFSPFIMRQNAIRKDQKQIGGGIRIALRQYLFTRYSPRGFFIHVGGGLRTRRVNFIGSQLETTEVTYINSAGLNAAAGYQWLLSPRDRNIALGFSFGPEYFLNFYNGGHSASDFTRPWYTVPFLDELRLFLTFEVGFAWRQDKRHW